MDKHKEKDVNPRDKRKSGKIKNAYNFKNLQTEIRGYGYEYKFGKFFLQLLIVFLAIIVAGLLYKLNTTCIVVLCIIALVLFPVIIAAQFRYIYEQKKFTMLVEYLEHMIFNFKKTPKILVALRDTRELVSVEMQSLIDHAIEVIENREDATNLYQEAFTEFEKQFPCSRLLALHRFLINIELQGGKYQSAIDLLLVDIRAWVERTYIYQKELKNIKNKIVLSLAISMGICGTMIMIVPEDISIKGMVAYQILTTILLIGFLIIFTFMQTKLNGAWLVNDTTDKSSDAVKRAYDYVRSYNEKKAMKKSIIKAIIFSIIIVVAVIMQLYSLAVVALVFTILLLKSSEMKFRRCRKRVERELEKEFPQWLRDVALNLQKQVVPLAIRNSISSAAPVLQEPLEGLVEEIEENPTSIKPYVSFLGEYNMNDLSTAMKMLYTLQSLGSEDSEKQLHVLIERNQSMLEKSERIRNEDMLGSIGFIVALPMLLASLKLVADLGMILMSFFSFGGLGVS